MRVELRNCSKSQQLDTEYVYIYRKVGSVSGLPPFVGDNLLACNVAVTLLPLSRGCPDRLFLKIKHIFQTEKKFCAFSCMPLPLKTSMREKPSRKKTTTQGKRIMHAFHLSILTCHARRGLSSFTWVALDSYLFVRRRKVFNLCSYSAHLMLMELFWSS